MLLYYAGGGAGEGHLSLVFSTNRINKYGTQWFCHGLARPLSTKGHKTAGLESSLYSPLLRSWGGGPGPWIMLWGSEEAGKWRPQTGGRGEE